MLKILSTLLIASVLPMTVSAQTDKERYAQQEVDRDEEAVRQSNVNQPTPAPTAPTPVATPEADVKNTPSVTPTAPKALSPNDIKIAAELQSLETEVFSFDDISTRFTLLGKLTTLTENYEKNKGHINPRTYKRIMGGIAKLRSDIENARNPQTEAATPKVSQNENSAENEENKKKASMTRGPMKKTDVQSVTVDVQPKTAPVAINEEMEKKERAEDDRRR